MNLFLREMKRNSISFIIWLLLMVLVNALMLASFGSVAEMATNTESMLSQYPEEFVKAMNLDILQMTNILHYYASRSFLLLTILGSIYAMILSSCIISKEESDKTIEFLISKPISRTSIIASKLACTICYVSLFNLIFSISNFILFTTFKTENFSLKGFLFISLGAWFIHMIFAFIGLVISVCSSNTKTNISLSLGIVFLGYFLSILVSLKEEFSFLKYLSPFSYFNAEDLVINTTIQIPYLVITFIILVMCLSITFHYYKGKNISA